MMTLFYQLGNSSGPSYTLHQTRRFNTHYFYQTSHQKIRQSCTSTVNKEMYCKRTKGNAPSHLSYKAKPIWTASIIKKRKPIYTEHLHHIIFNTVHYHYRGPSHARWRLFSILREHPYRFNFYLLLSSVIEE